MNESEPKQGTTISPEEFEIIRNDDTVGAIYKMGFLITARRNGLSIEETHLKAILEPSQEEHYDAYQRTRKFFLDHAQDFGLKTSQNS